MTFWECLSSRFILGYIAKTITRPPQIPPLQKKKIDVHDMTAEIILMHSSSHGGIIQNVSRVFLEIRFNLLSAYFLNCHFLTNTKRAVRKVDVPMVIHSKLVAFRSPRSPLLQSARKKITKSLSCF